MMGDWYTLTVSNGTLKENVFRVTYGESAVRFTVLKYAIKPFLLCLSPAIILVF